MYGYETIFCYLSEVSPSKCWVLLLRWWKAQGRLKKCFIKLFIVDNCTISLIIRTILDISVMYSEMTFVILCALKRDFGIFIKEKLWGFDAFYSLKRSLHFHIWHGCCSTATPPSHPMPPPPPSTLSLHHWCNPENSSQQFFPRESPFFSFVKLYMRVPQGSCI